MWARRETVDGKQDSWICEESFRKMSSLFAVVRNGIRGEGRRRGGGKSILNKGARPGNVMSERMGNQEKKQLLGERGDEGLLIRLPRQGRS